MTISGQTNVAASATVNNILAGSIYEFLADDAYVEVGLNQAVTGIIATVKCDNVIALEDFGTSNILVKTTSPIYPDDYVLNMACLAGSRLSTSLRNTTAAAVNVFWSFRITPV